MPEVQGPPPLPLFLLEGQRALLERLALAPAARLLRRVPRGDGHPVLVLPGFSAGDRTTRALRRYLREFGYAAHRWRLGPNFGPHGALERQMVDRIHDLAATYGRKVSLVGWSLGGIYARELARGMPDRVRQVVTLGSPFGDTGRASNVSRLFEWFATREISEERVAVARRLREPPGVPSTAIFSKTDGVTHWKVCLERETPQTENIEVPGSHCGLGVNPLVLYAVADRLRQPEGDWRPFARHGWRALLYG